MSVDPSALHERLAWLTWSGIAEPGDEAASWVVDRLGPQGALAWLSDTSTTPNRALARLSGHGAAKAAAVATRAAGRWIARLRGADPDMWLAQAKACGARVLVRGQAGWPTCLDSLGARAPFALWVRGNADLGQWASSVAIVGARSATHYGTHMASLLAAGLVDQSRPVVSGGAYGIDAAAHRAVVAADGVTFAVLAGGIDQFYPAGNADLLTGVLRAGAVIAEVPPGYASYRSRFLSRNRLIATAAATVVVEAAPRSGALSTARHALSMARPLAAVPGPVTSAASAGCHSLVRSQEAVLVTSAADVLELVDPLEMWEQPELELTDQGNGHHVEFAHPHDRQVYDALGKGAKALAKVALVAGVTPAEAQAALGRLELQQDAEYQAGRWRRMSPVSRKTDKTP